MNERPLVFYITAHGYGHAVRSCDIIRAWGELYPRVPCWIVSGLSRTLFDARFPDGRIRVRRAAVDAGVVQRDSVRGDMRATLTEARRVCACRPAWVAREAAFLRSVRARGVVCDIPSIPLEAAARVGIPGFAVGNFSWDWIYRHFEKADTRWKPIADMVSEGYSCADLLLRLPFHEPMASFRCREDIPLVARPGRNRREELAAQSGMPATARWVLLAFARIDWSREALDRLDRLDGYVFLAPAPADWAPSRTVVVDRNIFPFSDLVASSDAVLSKPGFGILSDCAVNRVPLAYALRADFPEMEILVPSLHRHVRGAPVTLEALYGGDVHPAVESALHAAAPVDPLPAGGDLLAARRIAAGTGASS